MELIDESKPVARNDYVCDLCNRKISKGKDTEGNLFEVMAVTRGLSKGMKNAVS